MFFKPINKWIHGFILTSSVILFSPFLFAQSETTDNQASNQVQPPAMENLKTITLQDGTRIKGKLVGVQGNVYTIETSHFGTIAVKDTEVSNISSFDSAPAASDSSQVAVPQQASFKDQVDSMKQRALADPDVIASIQEMAQDPELMSALSDPEFVKAVTSYDLGSIKNNPKAQALMQNPKMQQLMEKIKAKQSAP